MESHILFLVSIWEIRNLRYVVRSDPVLGCLEVSQGHRIDTFVNCVRFVVVLKEKNDSSQLLFRIKSGTQCSRYKVATKAGSVLVNRQGINDAE